MLLRRLRFTFATLEHTHSSTEVTDEALTLHVDLLGYGGGSLFITPHDTSVGHALKLTILPIKLYVRHI